METLNPNDLHLQLFAEENPISFDTILNYRKKIIFGIEELKQSENSTITAQDVKIIYQDNSKLYDLVISFLNDSEAQSKQTYKLIIPNGYQSLTIYGRISREYNIAIELEDRKDKLFVLNLHTFVTNGMAKTTTIKTNSECLLTINAYGEKVIIKGANGSSSGESGQNAIEAYDLEINNYTEDIFSIIGGNGVNGANGVTSEMNKNTECWQRKGKDGGAGGIAIVGHNIYFGANAFIISVTGGNGGNGGKGGEATGKFELYPSHNHMALFSGGDGGAGGNGGDAIRYSNYVTSQYQVKLTGGSAGAGGKKGNPNKSCWLYNNGPWFGTNGKNGIDGKTMNKVEE